MVNADTLSNQPLERWLDTYLKEARAGGSKLFASVAVMATPEETAAFAKRIAATGFCDLLELNASCPMEGNRAGADPDLARLHVQAVRESVKLPITFKLSSGLEDPAEMADAVSQAGVDGLVLTNSLAGFAGVDVESGKPWLPCIGGYSGPAIKPVVQAILIKVASVTKTPILAVGGATGWSDVLEYIFLGATAVGIATSVMWNGYRVIGDILSGLAGCLERKSCASWDEIRGFALRDIMSVEDYAESGRMTASIGHACVACGICEERCFYGAITQTKGKYVVHTERCDGCGLCVEWCPKHAVALERARPLRLHDKD
jgi:dihydroorotate dehydrogenase subfamily 1